LWVSKQHGHGPETMFRAYTAWTEGAPESEIEVIKAAMGLGTVGAHERQPRRFSARETCHRNRHNRQSAAPKCLKTKEKTGGGGGNRTARRTSESVSY